MHVVDEAEESASYVNPYIQVYASEVGTYTPSYCASCWQKIPLHFTSDILWVDCKMFSIDSYTGQLGLGGMAYLVQCLTEEYIKSQITWQWLLGRLYIVERLIIDFPTEFLPRQRPDGASSESSLELIGAISKDEDERPENYDRLSIVAEFAIIAVSNPHARICRVAKRVFLLAARYAAHLEDLITEFTKLLDQLDFTHKKSLKRQLEKIVGEFQLSEQIGRQLHVQKRADRDACIPVSPDHTPSSSPRCTSPVTVISDGLSEAESNVSKNHPRVPPNTPVRDRKQNFQQQLRVKSFEHGSKDTINMDEFRKLKPCKSLDDLDSMDCRPRRKLSKSPVVKKIRSRSRSNTPQRIGPVLETNLDDVIRLEESRQRLNSHSKSHKRMKLSGCTNGHDDDDVDDDDLSFDLGMSVNDDISGSSPLSPPPRLLSHDIETDIDSVEPDLDSLIQQHRGSCNNVFSPGISTENLSEDLLNDCAAVTPNVKLAQIPKFLSLDLDGNNSGQKSKRSISPCAHVLDLERLSKMNSISETPCQNYLSQSNTLIPETKGQNTNACTVSACDIKTQKHASASVDCSRKSKSPANRHSERRESTPRKSMTDDSINYMAMTPCSGREKPVTFQTEVAMATPKHSPSHTLDKGWFCYFNAHVLSIPVKY